MRVMIYMLGILIFLGLAEGVAYGQKKSIFDRLQALEAPVELEIKADLAALEDQRNTNEYVPAVLSFQLEKKVTAHWNIELRSRGKYRRRICVFPPLKVKFPKAELKAQGYNSDNEFKLVTHCVDGEVGKEYIVREYLVYKLFEQVSPELHLKVLLARIRYLDERTEQRVNGWGILVEDEKALERRFGGKVCDSCFALQPAAYVADNLRLVYLFQYLIGNTDWNPNSMHNVLLLRSKETGKAVLVPYDFDFSGVVNATYAVPNVSLGQRNVRDRLFMSTLISDRELEPTKEWLRARRSELEEMVWSLKWLSATSKTDVLDYLESFYTALDGGLRRVSVPREE